MNHPQSCRPFADFAALVSSFAQEMNAWEQAFYKAWYAHLATCVHDAPADEAAAFSAKDRAIQQTHRERYATVFSTYCTPRKRSRGGPDAPLSAGIPTKYQGVERATFQAAELATPRRAEVTFLTDGPVVNHTFKFVVLRTKMGWRIDGFKYQFRGQQKWNVGIL